MDAVRLTKKYGGDPNEWNDVKHYLIKKSYRKYFTDPVVEFGYCRGSEPVEYVRSIMDIYHNYLQILGEEEEKEEDKVG